MVTDFWDMPEIIGRSSPGNPSRAAEFANAAVYYGSFGLLDPKMPFEAAALRRAGWPIWAGAGLSVSAGFAIAALSGLIFDPHDKVSDWPPSSSYGDPHNAPGISVHEYW
jgi:hypothetical protein